MGRLQAMEKSDSFLDGIAHPGIFIFSADCPADLSMAFLRKNQPRHPRLPRQIAADAKAAANKRREDDPHFQLVLRAEAWLKRQGCNPVLRDPFKFAHKEHPDAIGWRDGLSVLVEVKVTRADFLADGKKPFRQTGGMGDWRFFMCPEGLISEDELPEGWGLISMAGSRVSRECGVPTNTRCHTSKPFVGNKDAESRMLASALRRLSSLGHLSNVY